jgi:adenosylhomocysteine nucleosidase
LSYRRGGICTSDHIITAREEKRQLFEQTGALAVDMETEIVRRAAQQAGLPMATVRAISDPADQDLPSGMERWIDGQGRVRIGVLAGEILRRPGNLPGLVRLGRQSRLAAASLGAAMNLILRIELTPSPTGAIRDQ